MWRFSEKQGPHSLSLVWGHGCHIGQTSHAVVTFEGGDRAASLDTVRATVPEPETAAEMEPEEV